MNPMPLDITVFRAMYTEFADETKTPDAMLNMWWNDVGNWISENDAGDVQSILSGDTTVTAMMMLLAHFLRLSTEAASGQQVGFKTSAGIDKISVAYLAPPAKDQFSWWLSTTPYGAQLGAYLEMQAVGGFMVGGRAEQQGFRKIGGSFF